MPAYVHPFEQSSFESETSKEFDSKEIACIIARFEETAKELLKDKELIKKVISFIDLTILGGNDTKASVVTLLDRGLAPLSRDPSLHCAAFCVLPQRVADVTRHLESVGKKFNVSSATGGFPLGQLHLQTKVLDTELSVADGATEIDIVISRTVALEGDWQVIYDEIVALKKACGPALLKTILSTGELKTLSNVYKASWVAILAGTDFIKTSTGKECVNATLEVSYVMCQAIKRWFELTGKKVGFKPAGGIRTTEEALAYVVLVKEVLGEEWLTPEVFRIGASSLLDDCLQRL